MAILVTGGAGFIGSHTSVELLNKGKEIVIIDNFSNSKPEVLDKIKKITGKDFKFYEIDYLDKEKLEKVFEENKIEAVMNFAKFFTYAFFIFYILFINFFQKQSCCSKKWSFFMGKFCCSFFISFFCCNRTFVTHKYY